MKEDGRPEAIPAAEAAGSTFDHLDPGNHRLRTGIGDAMRKVGVVTAVVTRFVAS